MSFPGGPRHRHIAAVGAVLLLLSFSGLIPLSPPASGAGSVDRSKLGISLSGGFQMSPVAQQRADLAGVVDVGATWIRLEINWAQHQPEPGPYHLTDVDRMVNDAVAKGLHVLGVVSYAPYWAAEPKCRQYNQTYTPKIKCAPAADRINDYAAFARTVASRYKGKVDAWEMWNEPSGRIWWGPGADPARYARMLRAAYTAIHAVNPKAIVVTGGLSAKPDSPDSKTLSPKTFLERMYAADPGVPFDGVGSHPYYSCCAPMAQKADNPFSNLPQLQKQLASHGDGDKKIWITEFGYESPPMTDATKGKYINQALDQVSRWAFVQRIFVFTYRDFPGSAMGFVRENGTLKGSRTIVRNHVLGITPAHSG